MSFTDSDIWRYANTEAGAPRDLYVRAGKPDHITPAPEQAGQRVLLPVWPDNDVFFEDCIIEAVRDYGHYQQGTTVQKYQSATGQIEHFRLIVRKYNNEQVWRVVHFTSELRRPACEISQDEAAGLNTFYSGIDN